MKNVKLMLWMCFFVALTTISCRQNFEFSEDENFDSFDDEQLDTPNADGEEGALTLYKVEGSQIVKIQDYNVPSNLVSFQQDIDKHHQMWDFFVRLIPADERRFFSEFEVFHGGNDLAGYVAHIHDNDLSEWRMGLAIDLVEDLSKIDLEKEFTYTSIHEYGHVLTLNNTQINANTSSCSFFEIEEGCSQQGSYINALFELGWKDIYDEFQLIRTDDEAYDFYEKYADRFVTDYAATNPAEDIAEVFSVFVTQENMPTGNSIADQKVKLMYNYPELVRLREDIRQQAAVRALKPGSWKRRACRHQHHQPTFAVGGN